MSSAYPYAQPTNFVDLLNSQQDTPLIDSFASLEPFPSFSTQTTPQERKERAAWHPSDDVLLISSWLNTSKDSVVGNEQKSGAFWQRVADSYAGSPNAEGRVPRTASQCKHRWHKINDLVCKFSGAYDSAIREKTSGMNENDVLKLAHQIFFTNHKKKFNLEYAWKELRNDQKWCDLSNTKGNEASKKRRTNVMETEEMETVENDGSCSRPIGVKAAKAKGKKTTTEGNHVAQTIADFQKVLDVFASEVSTKQQRICSLTTDISKRQPIQGKKEISLKETGKKAIYVYGMLTSKKYALGRPGLSGLQICTSAIRLLAYGTAADSVDEYLRIGATSARNCLENFVEAIINLFGDEYLRRPTPEDLQRLLDYGEYRGFPGMVGSIDCMHWEWKNCPTAWKGQYSRGSDKPTIGKPPQVNFSINGREYDLAYYLTDGIYPKWATVIQSIPIPQDPKACLFAEKQEAARKDVERAFGVLQSRFAIIKKPALFWDKKMKEMDTHSQLFQNSSTEKEAKVQL
ncbi:uncharacterized protein LOC112084183 [Eutrema salsugineum]|uniref:uncharacterized protein LOC112084183 n=1 Tax=Eutrema salsugineum TaxID=72664 RepID=UPI000CED1F7B|nr:uncharacterized protein LOC112084183 [Eutrema salsugineum]